MSSLTGNMAASLNDLAATVELSVLISGEAGSANAQLRVHFPASSPREPVTVPSSARLGLRRCGARHGRPEQGNLKRIHHFYLLFCVILQELAE